MSWLSVLIVMAVTLPAAGTGRAEIVTIPLELPESPCFLRGGDRVAFSFDAGRPLPGATSVALRVAGTGRFARSVCWHFGNYGGGVWFRREDVGVTAMLLDAGAARADTTLVLAADAHPDLDQIAFEATLVLAGEDWSFLTDGRGSVLLDGLDCAHFAVYPEVCICDPSAALTGVSLVVALDGEVPAAARSWGALKARYR